MNMMFCRSRNGQKSFLGRRATPAFFQRLAVLCLTAVVSITVSTPRAHAQPDAAVLPDAPQPQGRFSGSIYGTVLDTSGAPVQGAEITLRGKNPPVRRTMASDAQGAFRFAGLAAETYTVTVRDPGMQPVQPTVVPLGRGEAYKLPITAAPLPKFSDTVRVTASPLQIATAQVHEQEKQRVLGIVPNFYTSYLWNAAPMSTKLKYHLVFRSLIDPITIAGSAGVAGVEQWKDIYPGYGSGIEGYAKRFGASYADSIDARLLGRALLPGIFHQDPRYFYRGSGSVGTRIGYAVKEELLCRGDNGKQQLAYSRLLGDFAAAGISNVYHSPADRGVGITFRDAGVIIGANAAENVLIEFLSRSITTHVPGFENGKKSKLK
jgi:Carboxypeptidase regulatory-like domain